MRMLLHACCGPCSLEPVRLLREQGFDITILYANSNIAPEQEYLHRLETLRAWAASEGIAVEEGSYDPAAWQATAGRIGEAALEAARTALAEAPGSASDVEGERGAGAAPDAGAELNADQAAALAVDPAQRAARCRACYRLRLEEAAQRAAAEGFDVLSTTLAVSPYQYFDIIGEELQRAADKAGIRSVYQDFRPFYPEATRESRKLGMYRQNYCGCLLSKVEAEAERIQRKAQRAAEKRAEQAAHAQERAAAEQQQAERKAQRAAYDAKQARKRAILKALREQQRGE